MESPVAAHTHGVGPETFRWFRSNIESSVPGGRFGGQMLSHNAPDPRSAGRPSREISRGFPQAHGAHKLQLVIASQIGIADFWRTLIGGRRCRDQVW